MKKKRGEERTKGSRGKGVGRKEVEVDPRYGNFIIF